jgi:hypothetical protein
MVYFSILFFKFNVNNLIKINQGKIITLDFEDTELFESIEIA